MAPVSHQTSTEISSIPFPGVGARFELVGPTWDQVVCPPEDSISVRRMEFVNRNKNALFTELTILGYKGGAIKVRLQWESRFDEIVKSYFSRCGIKLEDSSKIFQILTVHNQIDTRYSRLVQRLLTAKDWRWVTPLTVEQERNMYSK